MQLRSAVLRLVLVGAVSVGVILGAAVPDASADNLPLTDRRNTHPLPVPHNFFAGVADELRHPGGSAPGTNEFSCQPSARHPNPVVLVHGTGGNRQTNWATLGPLLHNEGYCVFALTYGTPAAGPYPVNAMGGFSSMISSSAQLATFADRVLAATHARKIDIVGHSEGTLMPDYYVRYRGGASHVSRYVSIAPYWKGQDSSHYLRVEAMVAALGLDPKRVLPYPEAAEEDYHSAFMATINAGGSPYAPGVTYTNIISRHDGIVVPHTDGLVPGPQTTNIVVQDSCAADHADHLSLVASPRTAAMVLNALDPDHPRTVPCVAVAPGLLTG